MEGSIPAHAGEPGSSQPLIDTSKVYPRPRGGAYNGPCKFVSFLGLSPPTRGSLATAVLLFTTAGSIPAHAGEPTPHTNINDGTRVYPRPRGGAECGRNCGGRF